MIISPIQSSKFRTLKLYDGPKVDQYLKEVLRQIREHRIKERLEEIKMYIKELGFDSLADRSLEQLDNQLTLICLQSEKTLTMARTIYNHTEIAKSQVGMIRPLEHLQCQYQKKENAMTQ